eukprot:SAG11_NODE_1806_length_4228_cov_6.096391_5_plen_185_part_00
MISPHVRLRTRAGWDHRALPSLVQSSSRPSVRAEINAFRIMNATHFHCSVRISDSGVLGLARHQRGGARGVRVEQANASRGAAAAAKPGLSMAAGALPIWLAADALPPLGTSRHTAYRLGKLHVLVWARGTLPQRTAGRRNAKPPHGWLVGNAGGADLASACGGKTVEASVRHARCARQSSMGE